jgi:hypothetical protein
VKPEPPCSVASRAPVKSARFATVMAYTPTRLRRAGIVHLVRRIGAFATRLQSALG